MKGRLLLKRAVPRRSECAALGPTMIVVDQGGSLTLIGQTDHARFAGELLALWRTDGMPHHPRRSALLLATREHDNGWREIDAAPPVDLRAGRPFDFLTLPDAYRQEIWRLGPRRLAERDPYAALLVTRHALTLHRDRADQPGWHDLLEELEALHDELLDRAQVTPEALAADYRFLHWADLVSLTLCNHWHRELSHEGLAARVGDRQAMLEPFPLAGSTTFRIACRSIPNRRYAGELDLAGDLARARWEELTVRVVPP